MRTTTESDFCIPNGEGGGPVGRGTVDGTAAGGLYCWRRSCACRRVGGLCPDAPLPTKVARAIAGKIANRTENGRVMLMFTPPPHDRPNRTHCPADGREVVLRTHKDQPWTSSRVTRGDNTTACRSVQAQFRAVRRRGPGVPAADVLPASGEHTGGSIPW